MIRLMYRQRFFQSALPTLIDGFRAVENDSNGESAMETNQTTNTDSSATKANYLTALSHFLMYLPKQVRLKYFIKFICAACFSKIVQQYR